MSAERENSPVGKKSQFWLCDSNLIRAGPQCWVAGPAVSLGAGVTGGTAGTRAILTLPRVQ